ncbi:MAG: cupin domain-containing protein [Desulfitobacteriaceae bacterium]
MPKPEMDFFNVDTIDWKAVEGTVGVKEKILSLDEETGSYTRLLLFEPGATGSSERLYHDFWEEVYILKGGFIDLTTEGTFLEGYYACRPPGMYHGPYAAPMGCMTFEIRTYVKV